MNALESLDTSRTVGSVALRWRDGARGPGACAAAARRARTVFRILASAEAVGVSWASAGDGSGVRQGSRAVRQDHRHLPGRQAPRRQHARRRRTDHRRDVGCRARRRSRQRLVRCRGRGVTRHPCAGLQRAEQHSAARWHRLHLGARRTSLPSPGSHAGRTDGRRRRPAVGRRGGRSAAARRTVPRSRCRRRPTSIADRPPRPSTRSARCPRTSSATSSSTPAIWSRTGRSRGAARPMCSSNWSSRRSSPTSSARTWASPVGWR